MEEQRFRLPFKVNILLIIGLLLGLVSMFFVYSMDVNRALALLLMTTFFILIIALFGAFFSSIQFVSGAMWSVAIRRLPELLVFLAPVVLLLLGIVIYEMDHIYHHWIHWRDLNSYDPILEAKEPYLNKSFFIVRVLSFTVALFIVSFVMKVLSCREDAFPQTQRKKLVAFSVIYLILFAYLFSLLSIDLVMSLEPHWYTTMFTIYCIAGLICTGFAVIIFFLAIIKKLGGLKQVTQEHLHDLGKFQFSFVCFWTYIAFSQFMLIWYANIPEETIYLEKRLEGFGLYTTFALWFLHFVVPFFGLLSRSLKRNYTYMLFASLYLIFVGFLDVMWMVYPALEIKGFLFFGLGELGVFIGILSIVGLVLLNAFTRVNQMPIGDQNLVESLNLHQKY